jgi:hypothetical protein
VFLSRAEPASIGLSSIGARLGPVSLVHDGGLYYSLSRLDGEGLESTSSDPGAETGKVLAPIAPGVIPTVPISSWCRLALGERVAIARRHCTIALNGERDFSVSPHESLEIAVQQDGPPVVKVEAALHEATSRGLFRV